MSSSAVSTKSILKTKKPSKTKLFFQLLRRIIKNNPKLFLFCALLSVLVAVINFNIGANLRNFLSGAGEKSIRDAKFSFNFNFFG